jgi:hypothetical protein
MYVIILAQRHGTYGKLVHCQAPDMLLLSHPLKRTGVYRVLHSNEHSTDSQRTLLLLLYVRRNMFTASLSSKAVYTSHYITFISRMISE